MGNASAKPKNGRRAKTGYNSGGWIDNKRIQYGGYVFKSELEVDVYKYLLSVGVEAEYEPETFTTLPGCESKVVHYYSSKGSSNLRKIGGDIDDIEYTPDFHFVYNGEDVFVETKGRERDDFGIRKKLFMRLLSERYPRSYYFVLKSVHHARNMMEILENGKIKRKKTTTKTKKTE